MRKPQLVEYCQQDVLYSYTILTMDAPRYLQWLHNRVPLILDGDEAVASWLDPNYSFEELTYSVRCPPNLVCHPVSPSVAKVTNNTVECVLPYHGGESRDSSPVGATPKKRASKSPVKPVKKAHRSRSRSTARSASFRSSRSSSSERSRRRSRSRNASAHRRSKTRHRAASDSSERRQRKRSHRRSDSHRHGRTN